MKMLFPERLTYKGPDPPPAEWLMQEEPEPVAVPAGKAPKGKEVAPVVEVEKSPEVEAADKTVRKFMKQFMTSLLD